MSKKILIGVAVILALAVLAWWLFAGNRPSGQVSPGDEAQACLIFQSEDPTAPCYAPSLPGGQFPGGLIGGIEQEPGQPSASSSLFTGPIEHCNDEASLIERNGCVSKAAAEGSDKSLCNFVKGALAQTACFSGIAGSALSETFSSPKTTYESFIKEFTTSQRASAGITASSSGIVVSRGIFDIIGDPVPGSPNMTVQAFYERTSLQATLALYAPYPYQAKPGSTVKLVGSGFVLDETNTVVIQGQQVTGLKSEDGMTLFFQVPGSLSDGSYEIWVENKRGSSRVSSRPIYFVVSQNPLPAPVVTSVSPANPSKSDTITLSGTNLSGIQGVYTSLGRVKNNSLSFRIDDLEYAHLVADGADMKGKKVLMVVFVQTEAGLSEQPFTFEVQF